MANTPDFADWLAICNVKADYCRLLDHLEYHLLANHLLENGLSLLFITPTCHRAPPWHSAEKSPIRS